MNRADLTADDYARITAARDAAIAFAKSLEDAFGTLIQVHHVSPSGEREMCVQFPHLGGELTDTKRIGDVIESYPLSHDRRKGGWQIEAMTEDAKEFFKAPAKPEVS